MARAEFSRSTKAKMFARAGGRCEGMVDVDTGRYAAARGDSGPNLRRCGNKIGRPAGRAWVADHIIPDAMQTDLNTLENGQCLCDLCDGEKTPKDQAEIAKSKRLADRQNGIRKATTRPLPGSKAGGWKQKVTGEWVRRG